jgi:formate dehydrogenase subunit gamma
VISVAKGTTKKIKKFSTAQIVFHWTYGVSWILLVLTGIIFLWRPDPAAGAVGLGPLMQGTVGQVARFLHRVASIGLMASPLIWLFGDMKSLWPDLKELLAFGKKDLHYMLIAPLFYTFGKPALPLQGKYNGGHKTNFYVVILTFIAFVWTGLVMWFGRGAVSDNAFQTSRLIHSVAFWGGLAMGLLHIYLTAIHPFTRKALESMLKGRLDLSYARAEHSLWVDELIKSGKAEITEEKVS